MVNMTGSELMDFYTFHCIVQIRLWGLAFLRNTMQLHSVWLLHKILNVTVYLFAQLLSWILAGMYCTASGKRYAYVVNWSTLCEQSVPLQTRCIPYLTFPAKKWG